MGRTLMDGDLIRDKGLGPEDLSDAANVHAAKSPKIYKISGFFQNFTQIDYTLLPLFPKYYFNKGELYKTEYYVNEDLTDLVLVVDVTYNRDAAGFAQTRTTRRRWVNNDDSFNTVEKTTSKNYTNNPSQIIKEGKRRRENIVDNLQIPTLTAIQMTMLPLGHTEQDCLLYGRNFLDFYDLEFKKFVNNASTVNQKNDPNFGRRVIEVLLETDSEVEHALWLDQIPNIFGPGVTIRQYLVNEFSA